LDIADSMILVGSSNGSLYNFGKNNKGDLNILYNTTEKVNKNDENIKEKEVGVVECVKIT
jgi:hypothetical protein